VLLFCYQYILSVPLKFHVLGTIVLMWFDFYVTRKSSYMRLYRVFEIDRTQLKPRPEIVSAFFTSVIMPYPLVTPSD
jgi:uncharacterized membrane protein